VFVDAAGTLLRPREPVGMTYARVARGYGVVVDPVMVQGRFVAAFKEQPGGQIGDGRAFWRPIVATAIGIDEPAIFEDLYRWYASRRAWWVDRDALYVLAGLARTGLRLGIISNFDLRLRTLYERFALDRMFPVLVCSAEVGVAKPEPEIFRLACRVAGVRPEEAAHVGDDEERDVRGAERAGLTGIAFDEDRGWEEVGRRLRGMMQRRGLYA
jgi:putative hydrolase of the HAD superfamily